MFSIPSKKSGRLYYLHKAERTSRNGAPYYLFFFSGNEAGAEEKLPEGYTVVENERTGLPFLKKNS